MDTPKPKTAKVVLAVPYDGQETGDTITVDAREAARLVYLGSARRVPTTPGEVLATDPEPDETWKAGALRAYAERHGIEIPKAARSAVAIFAVIGEATAPPTNPPAEAADPEETA